MKRAATGALLGLALGDATGFPAEFSDIARIAARSGPWRTVPLPLSPGRAHVTDETQVTLTRGTGADTGYRDRLLALGAARDMDRGERDSPTSVMR